VIVHAISGKMLLVCFCFAAFASMKWQCFWTILCSVQTTNKSWNSYLLVNVRFRNC